MPHSPKIVTCCYCGTRAALVLKGRIRHELSCSSCGAPLHELKMLRSDAHGDRELVAPSPLRRTSGSHRPHRAPKSPKRSSGMGRRLVRKLWDAADDVLDDVMDFFD